MKNPLKIIYKSPTEILGKKVYLLLFLFITLLLLVAYVLIPVFSIPGNDILFQLSVWGFKDYAVLIPLSFLVSLMITMQVSVLLIFALILIFLAFKDCRK